MRWQRDGNSDGSSDDDSRCTLLEVHNVFAFGQDRSPAFLWFGGGSERQAIGHHWLSDYSPARVDGWMGRAGWPDESRATSAARGSWGPDESHATGAARTGALGPRWLRMNDNAAMAIPTHRKASRGAEEEERRGARGGAPGARGDRARPYITGR